MIHKLPIEIISKIYTELSIKDARACTNAYYFKLNIDTIVRYSLFYSRHENAMRKMRQILEDRESIRIYMGESFPDSAELMERMTAYGAWVSGSRVLDFFTGGSIGSQSDWDFYIPTDTRKVVYFMEYMKTIGVTWMPTAEYYVRRIQCRDTGIVVPYRDLEFLARSNNLDIPDYIKESMIHIYEDDHDLENLQSSDHSYYSLIMPDESESSIRVHTGTYGSISIDSIIRGKLSYRGTETNIQLILTGTEKTSNLTAIRNFDLSIVQGAITGFMAFHMYSGHAYNRSGSIWVIDEANVIQCDITKGRVQKYQDRGFKLQDGSVTINENYLGADRLIIRHMGDPDTDIITYTTGINQQQDPYYLLKQSIYNYTWIETHSSISSNFIVDERRTEIADRVTSYLHSQNIYNNNTIQEIIYGNSTNSSIESNISQRYVYSSIDKNYYSKFRPLANDINRI
jgi:hypothetical protein